MPTPSSLFPLISDIRLIQERQFRKAVENLLEVQESHGGNQPGSPFTSIVVPVTSLAPEPYQVISPIMVVIQGVDGNYTANQFDANIGSSGETQQEAVDNLKELLVMSFESLMDDDEESLGPLMQRQKAVLGAFMKRI